MRTAKGAESGSTPEVLIPRPGRRRRSTRPQTPRTVPLPTAKVIGFTLESLVGLPRNG